MSSYSLKVVLRDFQVACVDHTPLLQPIRHGLSHGRLDIRSIVNSAKVLPPVVKDSRPLAKPLLKRSERPRPGPGASESANRYRDMENLWLISLTNDLVKANSLEAVDAAMKSERAVSIRPEYSLKAWKQGWKKPGSPERPHLIETSVSRRQMAVILRRLDQLHQCRTALLVWDWGKAQDGHVVDQRLYTQMLNLVGHAKMIPTAFTLLKEMQELFGSALDAAPYNALISALGRAGKTNAALSLYRQMSSPEGPGNLGLVPPTVVTYGAVIMTLVKAGRLAEAGGILNEMQLAQPGCRPNLFVFNTLISAWGRKMHGQSDVEALVEGMKILNLMPDKVTYTALLSAYGRWGLHSTVEALWTHAQGAGIRPDAAMYTALITSRARQGQVAGMEAVLEEMQRQGCHVDGVTMCAVTEGYFFNRRPEEAEAFLDDQISGGGKPGAAMFNLMLSGFTKLGRIRKVEGVLGRMRAQGCRLNRRGYEVLLKAYADAGHDNRVEATVRAMQAAGFRSRAAVDKDVPMRRELIKR